VFLNIPLEVVQPDNKQICDFGSPQNAGPENDGPNSRGGKWRTWKIRDQLAGGGKCKTWKMTYRIRVVHKNFSTQYKKQAMLSRVIMYKELRKQRVLDWKRSHWEMKTCFNTATLFSVSTPRSPYLQVVRVNVWRFTCRAFWCLQFSMREGSAALSVEPARDATVFHANKNDSSPLFQLNVEWSHS